MGLLGVAIYWMATAAYLLGAGQFFYTLAGGKTISINLAVEDAKNYYDKNRTKQNEIKSLNDFKFLKFNNREIGISELIWDTRRGIWKLDPRSEGLAWYFGSSSNSYFGNRILLVDLSRIGMNGVLRLGTEIEFLTSDRSASSASRMRVIRQSFVNYEGYYQLGPKIKPEEYLIVNVVEGQQTGSGNYEVYYLEKK